MKNKKIYLTSSPGQTKKLGYSFARQILSSKIRHKKALIIAIKGELGAGKTTFLKGFGVGLGIREKILSPTFVILKRFDMQGRSFKNFYHLDCYRVKDEKEAEALGFKEIILLEENIMAIEWPENIKNLIGENIYKIKIKIKRKKREITFYLPKGPKD